MSNAKWCDAGQHAYNANDPNAQTLSVTKQVKNEWGGSQPYTQVQDICADHAVMMGLIEEVPSETRLKPLKSIEADADKADAEMWKAKYEAEKARNSNTFLDR